MNGFWCECGCQDYDIWYDDGFPGYKINCVNCGRIYDVLSDGRYSTAGQTPPCPKCGWHNATMDTGRIVCFRCHNQFMAPRLIAGREFEGRLMNPNRSRRRRQ